ncbi:hypothetical protein H0H92_005642 [Tricholoma furcatifolium]|nr:hypothetical protein H0H92_005642 [Tricholoma furcatifolium]
MHPEIISLLSGLDSNPGELEIDPHTPCPRLVPPVALYDMHLDKGLTLRRVELIPSLPSNLKEAIDQIPYEDTGTPVEEDDSLFRINRFVTDAKTVAQVYQMLASPALTVASAFSFHPAADDVDPAVVFTKGHVTRLRNYYTINEDYGPEILPPFDEANHTRAYSIPRAVWEALDPDMRFDLSELRHRFPILAVWEMFFAGTEAEEGLRYMGDVAKLGEFPWTASHTNDPYPPSAGGSNVSPDAIDTAWGMTIASFSSTPPITLKPESKKKRVKVAHEEKRPKASPKDMLDRERKKLAGKRSAQVSSQEPPCWPTVSISPKTSNLPARLLMSTSMLQHAWARAVERDSTFIVFHCGTFERIGFRHRASQTLFLSDLIEPTKCMNPTYGHLHVGLFIAILKDSLDRVRQLTAGGSKKASMPRKRKRETQHTLNSNKRPRTRAAVAEETEKRYKYAKIFKAVSNEIKSRNLALLRIHHRHFNSFSSSSFLRVGAKPVSRLRYEPRRYFRLLLASKLEEGATADAHNATIEVLAPNGEVLSLSNVVVKIAFDKDQQDRLTNEFHIYQHMMSANVKSIPYVFGLFEDHQSKSMALIMTNVGTCILDRLDKSRGWQSPWPLPSLEVDGFAEALKSIHSAGVRHRDIRAENMVIGDDGAAYIIDFDRAVMDASERSRNRELDYMVGLMRADIHDYGEVMSFGSTHRYDEE